MRAEWKGRVEMAPFAEALGVTTDSVMAAGKMESHGGWVVLYTKVPTSDPDAWIWEAILYPDRNGILQVVRQTRREQVRQLNDRLAEHMEGLKGELGE